MEQQEMGVEGLPPWALQQLLEPLTREAVGADIREPAQQLEAVVLG